MNECLTQGEVQSHPRFSSGKPWWLSDIIFFKVRICFSIMRKDLPPVVIVRRSRAGQSSPLISLHVKSLHNYQSSPPGALLQKQWQPSTVLLTQVPSPFAEPSITSSQFFLSTRPFPLVMQIFPPTVMFPTLISLTTVIYILPSPQLNYFLTSSSLFNPDTFDSTPTIPLHWIQNHHYKQNHELPALVSLKILP